MGWWTIHLTLYLFFITLLLGISILLVGGAKRFLPKLFSAISSARVVWLAAFCLNLLDGLITWFLVGNEKINVAGIEGNPLVRFTLEHMGNGAGLFVYKALFCTILIVFAFRRFRPHERVVIVLFFFFLCINNLANLIVLR